MIEIFILQTIGAVIRALSLVKDEYAGYIDTTRVYGTGQSMGIMTILNMGAQRDNFFAGAAVTGGQWSNNYDKPFQNNGSPIRTPEVDPISFGIKDGQGYEHSEEWYNENFENWYYMISDDNIFIHTCNSDGMAWGEWNDTAEYFKTAGVVIPYETYDPYLSVAEQDAIDKALYENNDHTTPGSGIIWSSFTKGNHMSTWKYGWNLDYVFDWLFTQSNETAKARGKVEQLNNEWLGRDEEGNLIEGTGTKGLNSAQYTPRGADKTYTEGWTAIGIVEDAIEALPDPADVTEDDAKAIEAARELYDKLTDAQKAAIDNYDKLIEDEIALLGDDSLEYVEELKEAAEEAQAEADAAKAAAEAAQKAADEAVAAKAADAEAKVAAAEAAQKAAEEKAAAAEEKAAELEKALEEAKKASEDKSDEEPSPAQSGDQFPDVTLETVNKTSYNSIYWAVDNGIVKGYADGNFKPENICTREQFTIMLWRFAGQPASDAATADRFTDVADFSNKTARSAAAWAVEAGIVSGFSDGSFQPQADITRAQVAVMLYRYAGKPAVDAAESKFSDIGTYSATVQQAIIWAENAGIASGYKDGTFKPDDGCQRQHMAIFLYRYDSNIK